MSILKVLKDEELSPDFLSQVKEIESTGGDATYLRVFAHREDMFKSFFQFYFPAQEGGVLDVVFKEKVRLYVAHLNECPS
jgi:hypothetical protein